MSNLVAFEDLGELDGNDLKAVFKQVDRPLVLAALIGVSSGLRRRLLTKLPATSAGEIEAQVVAHGPISAERVLDAQQALVEALCRLSRGGQVAFDDPEDMLDMVA